MTVTKIHSNEIGGSCVAICMWCKMQFKVGQKMEAELLREEMVPKKRLKAGQGENCWSGGTIGRRERGRSFRSESGS